MKRLIAAVLFATAAIVSAAVPPPAVYDIEANFQQVQELPDQEFVQGASAVLRYRLKSGGKWLDLSGLGARWDARATGTSTQALQATASVYTNTTPNYFSIPLNSTQTGAARSNWVYAVIVTLDGADYPLGQGRLDLEASAWTGASAILSTVTAASYTDAAVSNHAAVLATTNSAGHVIIGAGLQIADGVLSSSAGAPAWGDVTSKPFTNLVDLTTNNLTGVNFSLYSLASSLAGYVATNDGPYLAALTNLTGTGGITISGTGRNRTIDGSGLASTGTVEALTVRVAAAETGKVDRVSTNGWSVWTRNPTTGDVEIEHTAWVGTNRIGFTYYDPALDIWVNSTALLTGGPNGFGAMRTGMDIFEISDGLQMQRTAPGVVQFSNPETMLEPYFWLSNGVTVAKMFSGSGLGITNLPALSAVATISASATNLLSFGGANSVSLTGTSARIIGMEIPTASANEGWLSVYVSTTNSVTWLTNQPHLAYSTAPTGRVQTVLYYLPAGSTNITGRVFQ